MNQGAQATCKARAFYPCNNRCARPILDSFMLKLETRAQLEALHSGLMKESLTLEYKSSGAVDKTQPKKEEIAKDALAFANAAGGQIVYGMKEKDNLPEGLDGGIDPLQFPGIWFEQV